MSFDPLIPIRLLQIQKWFAKTITTSLEEAISDKDLADRYISPSSTLSSTQRITIYQQQYWWRVLRILSEAYPGLTRLFGNQVFNHTIGIPYLLKYPSKTWSLNIFGKKLPQWISEEYFEEEKKLILGMAKIELAFEKAFFAKSFPPLTACTQKEVEMLLGKRLYFQPHMMIFKLPFHLFLLRNELLKESVEYWESNPFPELLQEKTYYFILYRNKQNKITWEEIHEGAYRLINFLQKGHCLQKACGLLEKEGGLIVDEAQQNLFFWLQNWIAQGLLADKKQP